MFSLVSYCLAVGFFTYGQIKDDQQARELAFWLAITAIYINSKGCV